MSAKIQKTISRLQQTIEEGQHYEAHQQLRTIAARYVKQNNYDAAIDILFSGAQSLLKAAQGGSGGDLCLFLVEVYNTAETKPDSANRGKILALLRSFPADEPSRKRFITEALGWSSKYGEFPAGDPEIHHVVGTLYAEEHDAYEAERHLTLGTKDSVSPFANLEYDWYSEDESYTAPLYAARVVLPYLLVGNVRDASRSLRLFTGRLKEANPNLGHQEIGDAALKAEIYPSLPLMNFLGLLLLTIHMGSADLYRMLQRQYSAHVKEVGMWEEALEQIGEMYFGIEIRRQTNPLFDMMGSLFGGGGGGGAPQPKSRRVEAPAPPAVDLD